MLDALADREDGRVAGAHLVVHDDAAVAVEAHRAAQRGVRADAHGHHDQVGRQLRAVRQPHRGHMVRAQQRLRVRPGDHADAAALEIRAQQPGRLRVELALHERRHQMQHGHLHAV